MIRLNYHPAFDPSHAMFRFLVLTRMISKQVLEFDKLRILDFYYVFPTKAADVRLRDGDLWVRKVANAQRHDYAYLPSNKILIERMRGTQEAAAQTLADRGVVDADLLQRGVAQFHAFDAPGDYIRRQDMQLELKQQVGQILRTLAEYPLMGRDGLKDRSGLLEFRYDPL